MASITNLIYLLLFLFANETTEYYDNEIYVEDISDLIIATSDQQFNICHELLKNFASTSAQFTQCVILNAKPISLCRNCKNYFENATFAFNALLGVCDEILVGVDRLEVVKTMSDNNINMWSDANCNNCYNSSNFDQLSTDVIDFFQLINETNQCFIKYNSTVCALDNDKLCGPREACSKCNKTYKNLKQHYSTYVAKFEFPNACMDVVDAMNLTRKTWNEFKCIRIDNDVFVLFTIVVFLCLTPIVFYLSHWISSDENKSRIVPQKRLVATRSHAQLSSSINFS